MGSPQIRFTIRRIMVAVAVVAIAAWYWTVVLPWWQTVVLPWWQYTQAIHELKG
jgi:hypothetical protein